MPLFSEANLFGMTIRESANDGSDFTNPDADYRRLFLGEDGFLHVKDSAGSVTDPYDTSGGSGISSGTSNPGSPSDGDLFYRSDLDLLIRYRSSGTRWVCTCPHTMDFQWDVARPISAANGAARMTHPGRSLGLGIFVEDFWSDTFVATTNDGTRYYTIAFDNPAGGVLGTLSTQSNAANAVVTETVAIDAVVATSAAWLTLTLTRVGSTPGGIHPPSTISYRFVAT